jgi:O-antigen ligase
MRAARRVLQVGALACVLASAPSPLFDLDRHQVPKELVLHVAAGLAAVLALRELRRLSLGLVDLLLLAYLALSLVSALFAPNHWLAFRAFGVTLSGALVFWTARGISRAGLGRPLLVAFALAAAIGAATGLLQAYGVELPMMTATRAPGGTFGNRNFMAHLVAIALPTLLLMTLETRSRARAVLGAVCAAVAGAALLLSRSRAAWLGAAAPGAFFLVEGIWAGGLWSDHRYRPRIALLGFAATAGITLALLLPNQLDWRSDSPYLESLVGVANFHDGSGHGRLIQYRNTLGMAADHPVFGVGPGNWPVAYPLYTTPGDPAYDTGDIMPTNPWPSSDWVATLAERGVPALLALLATLAVMLMVGWRRLRQPGREGDGLAGLALVCTLLALVVVGSFDAVLLLAVPSLFGWGILGALLPPQRELASIALPDGRRRLLALGVAAAAALFALRSAAQGISMLLAGSGRSVRRVTWAARVDPGSYRLRMLLSGVPGARGPCSRVRVHGLAAHRLFPHHVAPARVLRSCGVRVSVGERGR